MPIKTLKLLVILGAVALLTSACSLVTVDNSSGAVANRPSNSNIFFSVNSGKTWKPENSIPTTNKQPNNLNGLEVKVLRSDPEDSSAIYLASINRGLYYTYNIIKGWNRVLSLPATTINDVQVDPQSKCIIYAALANRLYRSRDCTRTWTQVYFSGDNRSEVNTIAIDYNNPHNIYIGTSQGEIIKSIDSGNSWRTIHRLNNGIAQLIISPLNSSLLFVASVKNKIFSFTSASQTNSADSADISQNFSIDNWTDMNRVLADYKLGASFRNIIINPKDGNIFLATDKLILRSPDKGITWEKIKLISSSANTGIRALAVNPQNSADLYYVTDTAFFRSSDGGITWKIQKLPIGRAGQTLLINPQNPNNIYLGTRKLK